MQASNERVMGLVVAAVAFDSQTDAVASTSLSLARQFNLAVRFVHVVPPVPFDLTGLEAPLYAPYPPINMEVEAQALAEQRAKMDELLRRYAGQPNVSGDVVVGQISAMVIAEAVSRRAQMIVTGYNPTDFHLTAAGLSNAVSLMHDAPMPVLAVCPSSGVDFTASGCRLLVLDDLQDSTTEAVRSAYSIASGLKAPHVRHVHVHGDFRELWAAKAHELILRVEGANPQGWRDATEASLMTQLGGRSHAARGRAEQAGAIIEFDLRHGTVREEISKATADHAADILVFGRHRLLRARPFLIGRMPLRAMLSEHKAVLVIPPASELSQAPAFFQLAPQPLALSPS